MVVVAARAAPGDRSRPVTTSPSWRTLLKIMMRFSPPPYWSLHHHQPSLVWQTIQQSPDPLQAILLYIFYLDREHLLKRVEHITVVHWLTRNEFRITRPQVQKTYQQIIRHDVDGMKSLTRSPLD